MNNLTSPRIMLVAGLLSVLSISSCRAVTNPLVGSWRWDNAKTLDNFKAAADGAPESQAASVDKARRFVEAVATRLRSNMVLIYTDHDCTQVITDDAGRELSRETMPYKLLELHDNYVLVDQFEKWGVVKIFRENDLSLYVEVKVGNFVYRDYFTRIPSTTSR
jgi:hypothetical protein